jgi:hypothetical protein
MANKMWKNVARKQLITNKTAFKYVDKPWSNGNLTFTSLKQERQMKFLEAKRMK